MNKPALRRTLLLVFVFTLALLPIAIGGLYVQRKHVWAADRLAQVEPRYARLLGLEMQRADIEAVSLKASAMHKQFIYPAVQDDAQTGNQAQQKVRDIFSAAGLQVLSSQVLPSKEEKGFDRIPLVVRAEGEILGVQSALAVLGNQQPVIVISEIDIQVQGGLANINPKLAPRLSAQFTLSVLRERS